MLFLVAILIITGVVIYLKFIKKAPQTLAEQAAIKFFTITTLSDTSVDTVSTTSPPLNPIQIYYTSAQLALLNNAYNFINNLLPNPISGSLCTSSIILISDAVGIAPTYGTSIKNQLSCITSQIYNMPPSDAKTAIVLAYMFLYNAIALTIAGSYNISTGIITLNEPAVGGGTIPFPMTLTAFGQWFETQLIQYPVTFPSNVCAAQQC